MITARSPDDNVIVTVVEIDALILPAPLVNRYHEAEPALFCTAWITIELRFSDESSTLSLNTATSTNDGFCVGTSASIDKNCGDVLSCSKTVTPNAAPPATTVSPLPCMSDTVVPLASKKVSLPPEHNTGRLGGRALIAFASDALSDTATVALSAVLTVLLLGSVNDPPLPSVVLLCSESCVADSVPARTVSENHSTSCAPFMSKSNWLRLGAMLSATSTSTCIVAVSSMLTTAAPFMSEIVVFDNVTNATAVDTVARAPAALMLLASATLSPITT